MSAPVIIGDATLYLGECLAVLRTFERDPDYFEIAKARIDYIRKSGVQVGLFGEAA